MTYYYYYYYNIRNNDIKIYIYPSPPSPNSAAVGQVGGLYNMWTEPRRAHNIHT